jgi:hypothetical protein
MKLAQICILLTVLTVSNQFMLKNKMLGSVPTDITACPESAGQNIQNFQATFNAKPKKASNLVIALDGTALDDLAITKVKLVCYSADGSQLYSNNIPYANTIAAGGNVHWDYTYYLPGIIPDGTYKLEASFYQDDATVLGCGQFHMSFP